MPIAHDDKDWTWVLERPCPECGFDARSVEVTALPSSLRDVAGAWRALLANPAVAQRPDDDHWSALEYACHVRDVFRRFAERLRLMLDEVSPTFPNWDQDATAIQDRYGEQDPDVVVGELEAAGEEIAVAFEAVGGAQWERPGTRSDGATFTVETLGRYLLHDPLHHVWDVDVGYRTIAGRD